MLEAVLFILVNSFCPWSPRKRTDDGWYNARGCVYHSTSFLDHCDALDSCPRCHSLDQWLSNFEKVFHGRLPKYSVFCLQGTIVSLMSSKELGHSKDEGTGSWWPSLALRLPGITYESQVTHCLVQGSVFCSLVEKRYCFTHNILILSPLWSKFLFFSFSTVIASQYNHLGTQSGDIILGNISCQHKQVCDRTPILTMEGGPSKDC